MKTRLYNARILEPDLTVSEGEIIIEDGVITARSSAADDVFDESCDIRRDLVIPGFCNAHTHSPMSCLRSVADGLPLDRWLSEEIFPREAKMTADDIYKLTKLSVLEYLSGGITSCFDMYYYPEAFCESIYDTGFRAVLCGAVNNFRESVELLEDYYNRYNNSSRYGDMISYKLGFHAEYTTSEDILKGISELAHKYKAPTFAHSSETESEVQGCIERHSLTPTEYFESLGLYDFGGGGFHCVYMSENDMDIYAKRGLYAVTNPCSNAKLASGIAPLCDMEKRGIRLAVGTDGPSSNNALSMFREMYLMTVLQKIINKDASAMSVDSVLRAATVGGAECMGINSGVIGIGKNADLAVIRLDVPSMQPINNIAANLVYSGSDSIVRMTMVNGKVLYKDGEYYVGEDPQKIYSDAQHIIKRISE